MSKHRNMVSENLQSHFKNYEGHSSNYAPRPNYVCILSYFFNKLFTDENAVFPSSQFGRHLSRSSREIVYHAECCGSKTFFEFHV